MKFSLEWLRDLSGYKGSANTLAELLSMHSVEAETDRPKVFENIIVAKVVKVEKHPNADRLRVIELTDGNSKYYPVVCGAWNFDAGAVVPLALPGAVIPHDQHDSEGKPFVLEKAVIRGVESQGMICSGRELGLNDDGSGILLLDSTYKLGEPLAVKDQRSEITIDISLPANRPDLISYRGIAREIAALSSGKTNFDDKSSKVEKLRPRLLKLNISDTKLCSRYSAVRLTNVEIKPSPEFIRKRLAASGIKPRNNVVDITNYVLLETGQPLHAFDAAKLTGSISVRKAYVNESIAALDGNTYKLNSDTLVIADGKKAVAIAGIIGGSDSAVGDYTDEIVLESANFNPISVRKAARELGLRTDASVRFEKNLPLVLTRTGLDYAVNLFVQYANAKPVEYAEKGNKIPKPKILVSDAENVNSLLGTEISVSDQKKALTKLEFKVQGTSKLKISVPEYRNDINIWQDLAEEIARVGGLNTIPSVEPSVIPSASLGSPLAIYRERAADILAGLGFDEIYTYSFISARDAETWDIDPSILVEVQNPLSQDQQFMRPNLVINGLKILEHNAKLADVGEYFEIGNIYWKEGREIIEKTYLSLLVFDKSKVPSDLLVGRLKEFFARLGVGVQIDQETEQAALIKSSGKTIGRIAHLPVSELNWAGVHLDFEALTELVEDKTFHPISKYPSITLDTAILVRKDLAWAQLEQLIRSQSELIADVSIFDIYTGKNVSGNRKSLAFRVVYQSPERTLTEAEAAKIHAKIVELLRSKFSAQTRD